MRKLSVITLIVTGALGVGGSALSLAATNAVPAAPAAASAPAASPVPGAVQTPQAQGQAAGTPVPSQRSMWHKLQAAKMNQMPAPASAPVSAPPAAP
jgi:hypothetical protein